MHPRRMVAITLGLALCLPFSEGPMMTDRQNRVGFGSDIRNLRRCPMNLSTGTRLTIRTKPATRYLALELIRATWLIARKRDRPQSTQSLDLDCPVSV